MLTTFLAASLILNLPTQTIDWKFKPSPGPLNNPLKGWVPFADEGTNLNQPYSAVYFNVSWRELEPIQGKYDFKKWESQKWSLAAAKDKHIVFRVYLDYPGTPTGVPQWLLDKGLKMTPYSEHGGGKSPDYSDPRLQKALLSFVDALGNEYNSNPRVAFIQLGMLGFWGEWHTWPHTEWFATPEFQQTFINRMLKAFPNKKLLARNPATEAGKFSTIGFHDDMIPQDTLGPDEWMFLPSMKAAGKDNNWKKHPTGGEMVPGGASQYMGTEYGQTLEAVRQAHFSWMGPYCPALTNSTDPQFVARCQELVRKMGYQFYLQNANIKSDKNNFVLTINGFNQGVAPFYYPWPVQFALFDSNSKLVETLNTKIDLREWLPGSFQVKESLKINLPTGKYSLGIGVIDPYLKKPNIEFANELSRIGNWQILGQIKVDSGQSQ